MRTANPNTLLQLQLRHQLNQRTPAPQFEGILDATIIDTDATNSTLPVGTCRVKVPSYSLDYAFGPIEYPSIDPPANGQACVVGFVAPVVNSATASSDVRVLVVYKTDSGSTTTDDFVFFMAG